MNVGVDPSKVVVTKLKLDKDRRALLERKRAVSPCWCWRLLVVGSGRGGLGSAGQRACPRRCSWD